ncbi:type II toxin-antitoxin system VapC family toxin [Sphingomonas sp. AX6]|uniref:type II toxin-antitoxin system VapC family toxin n=1 Tax=Sphingomonas sp. AX6 TaxID=2653171 RepID=UPI0012F0305B|nr:type II toxin-antitoxin system VapC family toxin [Sphingomonas sp. AX6]VXC83820.1 Twitching motility protein PilT [Sphingomonas sp. AX6]
MTLFVDASALVAIIAGEADGPALAERVIASPDPIWSAMSCWEAIAGLRHAKLYSLDEARTEVEAFARSRPFRLVSIDEQERRIALDAYHRFGKGRHPARLNMGDCFAYACARTNDAALLYKGDDFALTDLA